MYGVDLYRRLQAETGDRRLVARGRFASAGLDEGAVRGAPAPGRLGQDVRAAARADHARGGPGEVPADDARRRPRRGLAADGRLVGSVRVGAGPRSRRALERRHDPPAHPGHRDRRRPGTRNWRRGRNEERRPRDDRGRGRRQRRRHVRAGDRAPGRRDGPDHPDGPSVPVHEPRRGSHARPPHDARPRSPLLLPRGGWRALHGRLRARPDALVARRHPARLQPSPARPRLAALRIDHAGRHLTGPGNRERRRHADDQRPRGVHPGQRVHPRRERGAGLLRRRRVLRPWDRGNRRHREADGPLDRRRRARARPLEDGHPAVRRPVPEPIADPGQDRRELRDLLRHPLPERGAHRRPARSASARPTRTSRPWAPCSARSRCGSGPNWFTPNEDGAGCVDARGPRGASPARLGRPALVARDRGGGPGDSAGGGDLRRIELRQDRDRGPGRDGFPAAAVRERHRQAGRVDHLHLDAQPPRRHRVRLHRHAPRRGPVPDRDRHRVRQSRPRLDPQAAAGRGLAGRARRRRDVGPGVLRRLGPECPRHRPVADEGRPLERGVPVPDRARDHAR